MLKLTTYRRGQFPNLKTKLEEDVYTYASAMELRNAQKLASLCSEGPVAVDVSPLLPLLDPTSCFNDTASVTEVPMHQLPDDALFVADENAAAGHEYDMRTLFDEIEKSEIEGEPAEEAMRAERGAKLLIDLSSEKTDKLLDDFDSNLIGQGPFTNPGQPTRRRLLSRGCDGFASSRSRPASPATFDADSRCRLPLRSAARGAVPRRSSLLSRRKNAEVADMLDHWLDLQFSVLPMALRTAYCAGESRQPLCA